MSKEMRRGCRVALAVGLTLICILILRFPSGFRALLTVSLLSGLPTFQKYAMRQRFLLTWIATGMGIVMESAFIDAPWLYLPAFTLVTFFMMKIASRSRDLSTMTLVIYGLSASHTAHIIGGEDHSAPILDGIYRGLNVSIGILCTAFSFIIIPFIRRPDYRHPKPFNFTTRDSVYIGIVAALCFCLGSLIIPGSKVFVIMGGGTWAVQFLSASRQVLWIRCAGAVLGSCTAMALFSIFSASTNNVALFIVLVSFITGMAGYLAVKRPNIAPAIAQFCVSFLIPASILVKPLTDFHQLIGSIEALWLGILIATGLGLISQVLLSIENWAAFPGESRRIA